jgi:hypothetical protein
MVGVFLVELSYHLHQAFCFPVSVRIWPTMFAIDALQELRNSFWDWIIIGVRRHPFVDDGVGVLCNEVQLAIVVLQHLREVRDGPTNCVQFKDLLWRPWESGEPGEPGERAMYIAGTCYTCKACSNFKNFS